MTSIRIIAGTYGHREGGKLHPKDCNSGIFDVEDKEAQRLVALRVAEIAVKPTTGDKASVYTNTAETADSEPVSASNDDSESDDYDYEYDETTPVSKLRELGKALGLSFPVGTTKAVMLEELDNALKDGPDIGAEEPVIE